MDGCDKLLKCRVGLKMRKKTMYSKLSAHFHELLLILSLLGELCDCHIAAFDRIEAAVDRLETPAIGKARL